MAIKIVETEHKYGCAVACLAMILNKTYHEIDRDFERNFDKQGMPWEASKDYLGDQGFSIIEKQASHWATIDFARKEMLKPFAPIHLLTVRPHADSKFNHAVVMTDKGKILCPSGISEQDIRQSYLIERVLGLYK